MFYRKRKAAYEARIANLENKNESLKASKGILNEYLRELVLHPDSVKSVEIKIFVVMEDQMYNAFWSGERTDPMFDKLDKHPMNGIMFQMDKQPIKS